MMTSGIIDAAIDFAKAPKNWNVETKFFDSAGSNISVNLVTLKAKHLKVR
jgi:hypothetical protein